jgi:hypothetical protein
MTRRRFGAMLARIALLPILTGQVDREHVQRVKCPAGTLLFQLEDRAAPSRAALSTTLPALKCRTVKVAGTIYTEARVRKTSIFTIAEGVQDCEGLGLSRWRNEPSQGAN